MFNQKDFDRLVEAVDYFSLMTYDYSSAQRPGANSPYPWIKKCVELLDPDSQHRSKILLGFNFYGNDYSLNGYSFLKKKDDALQFLNLQFYIAEDR